MFDVCNCLWGTLNAVYRRQLLTWSIYCSKNGIENLRLPLQPSSPELFHPSGLFKVDNLTNGHWFYPYLVSFNQIQSLNAID